MWGIVFEKLFLHGIFKFRYQQRRKWLCALVWYLEWYESILPWWARPIYKTGQLQTRYFLLLLFLLVGLCSFIINWGQIGHIYRLVFNWWFSFLEESVNWLKDKSSIQAQTSGYCAAGAQYLHRRTLTISVSSFYGQTKLPSCPDSELTIRPNPCNH